MTRLEKLQEFLKADPQDSFTRYAIGLEYRAMQDMFKAIEIFEALVATDPGYVATYYQLADCYRQIKDKAKAKDAYQKGILQARAAQDLHAANELAMAMDELEDED
ncbi:MAG: tetratricopeptide repeat protein [Bacteroidota bacterium]|nr:tetratricopeptide repeat protein [Bacteroidota bacterium]MDP4231250.1 tetratricopeptide repeat protein [Bacteroidota bacterium]MDP4235371.1 tetratricopeptide repeat protein [Bacteroidota bacterium]